MEKLGDSLKDIIPPKGEYPCRGPGCDVVLELPGLCDECGHAAASEEHKRRVARWLKTIPPTYREARWENLGALKRHDGGPRVSLIDSGPEAVAAMRARVEGSQRVVLMGPSTAGKTTVAIAFLRAAVERNPNLWARFVSAADLDREETPDGAPAPYELARSAELLVLDDLGDEFKGAPLGSGLLAQRIGPVTDLIAERFDRCQPLLVTTGLDRETIGKAYGDRVYRRVFEGAVVIRLGGSAKVRAA